MCGDTLARCKNPILHPIYLYCFSRLWCFWPKITIIIVAKRWVSFFSFIVWHSAIRKSILFCPCAHLFVCLEIWIHGFLFHSMGCDPALSFILMFKLHQIWPEKAPSIWLLYLFDTSPYSLPSDTTTCPDSTSTFSKSVWQSTLPPKSWIPF